MWLASITNLLMLTAVGSQPGVQAAPAGALPEPIATRQTLFAIPFQVEQHQQPADEPVEVHLHASADRGATWHPYAKVAPAARRFAFRAAADGEYWFVVRTLDRSGRLRPERIDGPGLRVVVDTTLPKLTLQARRGLAGEVVAQWEVDEPNPKPESLSIQYRTDPAGPWQQVALEPAATHAAAGMSSKGEVTWMAGDDFAAVEIRAEVTDAAGNPAVSHAQLDPLAVADPAHTADNGAAPWRAAGPDAGMGNPSAEPQPAEPYADDRYSDNRHADNRYPRDHASLDRGMPAEPYSGNRYPDDRYADDRYSADRYAQGGTASGGTGHASGYRSQGAVAAEAYPPVADRYTPPRAEPTIDPTTQESPRPRMVNSRLFELDYDVASVGPSGIAKVELWATRDNGLTWRSFALDNDNRSPMLVKVDEEGIFGFRVVVSSGAGLGGQPPRSGDKPDILIGVDTTEPAARILSIDRGVGAESDHLIVRYEASDAMLAERPISLLYGTTSVGPWTPIVTDLENSGRHAWPINQRTPQSLFVRLEVRDEAGNVGTSETTHQLTQIDKARPSVQIRNVRPMGQAGRAAADRYPMR